MCCSFLVISYMLATERFFKKNYNYYFPNYVVEYVCQIRLPNEFLTITSNPLSVWKQLKKFGNKKRFFKSLFQPWSTPQPNVRDCALFPGQEQERSSGLLDSWSADATQPLASPGCLAPLCQPKMEKCGKTRLAPRRAAVLLYTFTDGLLMLGTDSATFSRLFTHTFFAQISSTRQRDVTVSLAPPGNARDPNRKCNYKTYACVTYRDKLLSDYFIQ